MQDHQYRKERVELPLIPLRGMFVFPHMVVHFDVGRDKSVSALEQAMLDDSHILLTSQKDASMDDPQIDDFYHVGTISKVKQMLKLPGGSIRVLVEGVDRGKVVEISKEEPHFMAQVDAMIYQAEDIEIDKTLEAGMRLVRNDLEEYIDLNSKLSSEILMAVADINDPGQLVDIIAAYVHLKAEDDQKILETFDLLERLEVMHGILQAEIELLKIEDQINQRVKKQINKVQKEYYLKEQMKAIQKELGEDEDVSSEVEEYREKIEKAKMPKEAKEKSLKEVDRLTKLSPHSPETGVIRTYLDWMVDLPWKKMSRGKIDIKKSRQILDEDHYGLNDVKERILEFIAVRKLTNSMKGPILCLVGPPGVGKTSIAKSIARSLNREFVRMSLGGVRDEAEIRGHRRTYIGAMPGRIISSIRQAGTKNPIFLFDEIDKIGSDYRGDPASGLLEVLDPEQNSTFKDHFLDVEFDLSQVFFLTTANTTSTIPRPLLDRMEVIEINSYTGEEKMKIAENYLLPKQIEEHGLKKENLQISPQVIRSIIDNYTREAGVRNLERNLANLARKAAKRIVEEDIKRVRINKNNLHKYLGVPKYRYDQLEEENQIGVANGLAWTAVGGETLSVEANIMPGTGKVQLTGQLGDVMKESAMAGISYIRANLQNFKLDQNFHKENDVHIHVPEGAIPKDGPSAGVTIATAVLSALCKTAVDRKVAMTGEITLRGRVLPVGGIKEKVLAANRMGIKKVLLPDENKKDLEEIPERIRKNLEFVFLKSMDDVLQHALVKDNDNNEDH